MANKTYRTANGKQVDIETLSLQNETIIAQQPFILFDSLCNAASRGRMGPKSGS